MPVFVDLSLANTVPVGSTLQPVDGAPTRVLLPAEPLVLPPTRPRSSLEIYCRSLKIVFFLSFPELKERVCDRLTGNIHQA